MATSVANSADIFLYEGLNLKKSTSFEEQKVVFHNPCFISMFLFYHYKIYPHQKKWTKLCVDLCRSCITCESRDSGGVFSDPLEGGS